MEIICRNISFCKILRLNVGGKVGFVHVYVNGNIFSLNSHFYILLAKKELVHLNLERSYTDSCWNI